MSASEDLEARAPRMGFYALLSWLERRVPSEARLGGDGPFASEPARLRHDPALSFSAGDVSGLNRSQAPIGPELEVVTTFLGLTGAVGPLPSYFDEELAQEDAESARRDFLDVFHHRLLSLLYRGLAKYDLAAEATADADDVWSRRVLALMGIDAYQGPPGLPAPTLLRLAPLFATCRRPAESLERVLEEVLGSQLRGGRVEVIPFTGEWTEIEADQRMLLGRTNHRLGESSVLGQRIFDRSGKFTLRIAPLGAEVYRRLMPGGDLHGLVQRAVSLFAGEALAFDLELGLETPPHFRLGGGAVTRLGRDTWLRARPEDARTTLRVRGSGARAPAA